MFKKVIILAFIALFLSVNVAYAIAPNQAKYGMRYRDEGANHSTPPSGYLDIFVNSDTLYYITDGGVVTEIGTSSSLTLDQAYDNGTTIDADADGDLEIDLTVTGRKVQIANTFAGTQAVMLELDAEVAQIVTDGILFNTTLGSFTDAIDVSDASITNAVNVGGNVIKGTTATIDFSEFDVSGTTGAITINDGGDAGSITIESTVLDINSLDFVGAGTISAGASSAITINPDSGSAAGEDLIVTAHNVQLTAAGKLTMSPDAAETLAIDLTDIDYTNAISVGDNAILGTTGIINYTNFDVDASGNVSGVGGTFTGNVSGVDGTFTGVVAVTGTISATAIAQDELIANTGNTTLTLDGSLTTGGVSIGTAGGSGAITLGGTSTAVNLPATVDLTLQGGDLSITDTANSDLVTLVNNSITTAEILDISASGTRLSGNVIKIVDGSTTADVMSITAAALTTGDIISATANLQSSGDFIEYTNTGAVLTGSCLRMNVTDGVGFTGYYIRAYDGAADDFSVRQYGATVIGGLASTNMLTVTTGDVQVDDGKVEINTDEDDTTKVERAQATVTGPVFSVIEQTHTAASGHSAMLIDQDTTTATVAALEIDTEGALAIKVDALIAAGDGVKVDVADSYTGQGFVNDLGPWLGTTGEGFINIETDSAATNEVGQAIRVNLQGTGTAGTAVEGKAFHAESQAAVKAGESLVYLDTLTNTAIHIDNEGTAADGIKIDVADTFTGQGIVADLGPWVGTAGEGFISVTSDNGAVAEAGQIIRINLQGTTADAAAISGKAIYAKDTAALTAGSYLAHFESTANGSLYASGVADISNAPLLGASPIVLEGATADAAEVTLGITDPTSDTTLTLPNGPSSGVIGSIVSVGTTQTSQAGAATSTVTGSTVSVPAGHAAAGQVYTWEMAGTKTGANNAMVVHLKLDGTQVMSLSASDATAADWVARFKCYLTAADAQKIHGELIVNGKVAVSDYAAGAVDISGAVDLITQITSANAGDTVTSEVVTVTYNE